MIFNAIFYIYQNFPDKIDILFQRYNVIEDITLYMKSLYMKILKCLLFIYQIKNISFIEIFENSHF